jgi:hypothetical protein
LAAPIARRRLGWSARLSSAAAKCRLVARLDDQGTIVGGHHRRHVADRGRDHGKPGGHRLDQRDRELLAVDDRAKMSKWPIQRAGSARNPGMASRAATPAVRASAAMRSLSGPSPTMIRHACRLFMAAKARTSRGRFLTARRPATVPITISPAGARSPAAPGLRRTREPRDRNAVGDPLEPLRRLLPFAERDPLQSRRRHDQPPGAAETEPPVEIAAALQPGDLVLVEPVLVMDQRTRPNRRLAITASNAPQL